MDNQSSVTNKQKARICLICETRPSVYTCPRCGINYCNLECYKSESHLNCSESFYKQWVEEELKAQENDPESRKQMVNILKRLHKEEEEQFLFDNEKEEETNDDHDESILDSDDELPVSDLESRLKNVNLDNGDEVWSVLTEDEKQEFEALLKNGEAEKLLPKWEPWWIIKADKKLIQEVEITDEEKNDYSKIYPPLVEVPCFNELSKASPNIYFNILNVVYAYTYLTHYYNGDYMNCPNEATHTFFNICENVKNNKVFENLESAKESVIKSVKNCDWLLQDEQIFSTMEEAAEIILKESKETNNCYFISITLSELHRLLSTAKIEIKKSPLPKTVKFSEKFLKNIKIQEVPKRSLFLCIKKIEFYLSWCKRKL